MSPTTVVSAPGKVLIAGGYLVLDPAYSGVVVSTSSRFYAVVQTAPSPTPLTIRVRSPQFSDATWSYSVSLDGSRHVVEATQEKYVVLMIFALPIDLFFENSSSRNKFVHLALQHTIALAMEVNGVDAIRERLADGLSITIVGDNDFYSQRATVCSSRLL
jgi:phosphomevalonate kinase